MSKITSVEMEYKIVYKANMDCETMLKFIEFTNALGKLGDDKCDAVVTGIRGSPKGSHDRLDGFQTSLGN
jgi:hypothetical protein